jgi:23S rRNA pseudouridine1911/1915/1917 synthase
MEEKIVYQVEEQFDGLRIDLYLAKVSDYSRAQVVSFFDLEIIFLNGLVEKKRTKLVKYRDTIEIRPYKKENSIFVKDDFHSIQVLYENDDFIVINKPPFFISECNQSRENKIPTLVDFGKFFWNDLVSGQEYRFGLVHRLDRETSGIMILAKNKKMYEYLKLQFQLKTIKKEYIACIEKGITPENGKIDINIVRSPLCPVMMTHSLSLGKSAVTYYEVISKKDFYDVIKCYPQTGRTHQIRVHLKYRGYPILGDILYNKKSMLISRQALHAYKISFCYLEKKYEFIADLPDDMKNLVFL